MAARRRTKEQTREQARAEQVGIWQALISEYVGVQEKFDERMAVIIKERDKWTKREQVLLSQFAESDVRIAFYHRKIEQADKLVRQQKDLASTGLRRSTESKLDKMQRLSRELAALTKELRKEGIDLDD